MRAAATTLAVYQSDEANFATKGEKCSLIEAGGIRKAILLKAWVA